MYEDYLENFVFKTARIIAMKLFGRSKRSRKENEEDDVDKENDESTEVEKDLKKDEDGETSGEQSALIKSDSQSNLEEEDEKSNEEIEKMLDKVMDDQRKEKAKTEEKDAAARAEYDALTAGLDEINFHFPLFFLLVVLAILGLPSVVTWAKNYHYARILTPDPMKLPATIVLTSLGFIWQLNTPRNM